MLDSGAKEGRLKRRVRAYWNSKVRLFIWSSLLRIPWLLGFNVAAAATLVVLFPFTAQGQDLLRIAAERGFGFDDLGVFSNVLFLIVTFASSLSLWYSSRLLLSIDYDGYRVDEYAAFGRRWWPRLVGSIVPLAIGVTFLRVTSDAPSSENLLGWLFLGMGVALLLFYIRRRKMFDLSADDMVFRLRKRLLDEHIHRGIRMLIAAALLVPLFVVFPVWLPQLLGAPAIAVLGIAAIALFGTALLTYAPMSRGAPPLTLTVLLLALVFGLWNDNHAIRVVDGPYDAPQRLTLDQQFTQWQEGLVRSAGAEPQSLVVVAASGGGIRAAYWTASTLAYLEQEFGAPFTQRLFAISGVSGGSFGAATYVTLKRAALETGQSGVLLDQTRKALGHDFLSPVMAGMLFPDLLQRFLPVPVALADRQRFLEQSWESAFDEGAQALFSGAFQDLYAAPLATRLPNLLLNTTIVETGQRGIISNMTVDRLPQVIDLLDPRYGLSAIRTSAAAGASARFTYVSPAGTLSIEDADELRLVDGGYFENSGAASIADMLAVLAAQGAVFRPILMIIDNDPTAPNLCRRDGVDDQPLTGSRFNATISEVAAPAQALLQTRSARGQLAEVTAADLVESMGGVVIEVPLAAVLRARLATLRDASASRIAAVERRYVEPPLGWSLSQEVRDGMDETLSTQSGGLSRELQYLAVALGMNEGTVPPCRAH